ncbi:hypothetical protein, partial [Desulfamplus magnetovallimortis]|uniref:hypothetical protein n=1 Tax=Desulfamplus magnetovallimortis TaxID=1246637 RepID=UPI001C970F76
MSTISAIAKNAVVFDLGETDKLIEIPACKTRLPYQICWFEFISRDVETKKQLKLGCLAVESNERLILFAFDKNKYNRWTFMGESRIGDVDGKNSMVQNHYHIDIPEKAYDDLGGRLAHCAHVISSACIVMSCNNVVQIENKPSKLQKMRTCNKRKNLFSTWTLHIKTERKEYEPRGGTHASPRVHLRRGHVRQFKPGQFTWVQPCLVRGQGQGMIHKDYALCSA